MHNIDISDNKELFTVNKKPIFYLADTVWSAFTNASMSEWEEYLDYRKVQGFNALQINILPQHDRSTSKHDISPFYIDDEGNVDCNRYNSEYFNRACSMLDMAVDRGFMPALVLLWCNLVPGTWLSDRPGISSIMPIDAVKPYVEFAVSTFLKYRPIYIISGDSDFKDQATIQYYSLAAETVRNISPDSLITFHMQGEDLAPLPECFTDSDNMDFYLYQSSHAVENQFYCHTLAAKYNRYRIKRPVINGEPCYEGLRCGVSNAGRFNDYHVRNAMWQSILAGAKAGFTYGAHGIWSWHKRGEGFREQNFGYMPFDWKTALRFKGAWDAAFGKSVFEQFELRDINPIDDPTDRLQGIRMAASESREKVVVYMPYAAEVTLDMDLSRYKLTLINLQEREFIKPDTEIKEGSTILKMPEFNSDFLFIAVNEK